MNLQECNCHDCTQARYRMSFQYQLDRALNPARPAISLDKVKEPAKTEQP